MLPLIYTNAVYTVIFAFVFGVWGTSEFLGPVRWSKSREGKKRDQGSLFVGAVSGSLGVILSLFCPLLLSNAQIAWQPVAFFGGILLILLGISWRWYAIRTLGKYFTAAMMIHADQQVVQSGPYKMIRHPSYSGVLLIIIGVGFMIGNWVSLLLITTGLFIGLLYRMSVEEQELLQHLGQPYKEYMQRTKRLIPFLF
jgi:protein-S-isoprenylcysteine O-methyltransferase Ste14